MSSFWLCFFYYSESVYLFHTSQIFITWEAATGCSRKKGSGPGVQNISLCLPGPVILLFFFFLIQSLIRTQLWDMYGQKWLGLLWLSFSLCCREIQYICYEWAKQERFLTLLMSAELRQWETSSQVCTTAEVFYKHLLNKKQQIKDERRVLKPNTAKGGQNVSKLSCM